ncbi:hypothetical protein JHK82_042574 [Glycine max]|nr:hypothetical protein JHK85_043235 [Glycine max]KAG5105604.1 hypothetical protein JHK82_042574 [Glycine max]
MTNPPIPKDFHFPQDRCTKKCCYFTLHDIIRFKIITEEGNGKNGFLMDTFIQLCPIGATTFIGFNIFHQILFQTLFQVMARSGDLTLELEPIAFTRSWCFSSWMEFCRIRKEGATNEEITTTITLANAKKFIDKLHQEGWIFIMRDLDCNRECKCLHQASVFQLHLRAINLSY